MYFTILCFWMQLPVELKNENNGLYLKDTVPGFWICLLFSGSIRALGNWEEWLFSHYFLDFLAEIALFVKQFQESSYKAILGGGEWLFTLTSGWSGIWSCKCCPSIMIPVIPVLIFNLSSTSIMFAWGRPFLLCGLFVSICLHEAAV